MKLAFLWDFKGAKMWRNTPFTLPNLEPSTFSKKQRHERRNSLTFCLQNERSHKRTSGYNPGHRNYENFKRFQTISTWQRAVITEVYIFSTVTTRRIASLQHYVPRKFGHAVQQWQSPHYQYRRHVHTRQLIKYECHWNLLTTRNKKLGKICDALMNEWTVFRCEPSRPDAPRPWDRPLLVCYITAGANAPVALLPSGILYTLFSRSSHCRRHMSPRTTRRERSKRREGELLMSDKEYPIILPKCRLPSNIWGSFTCRKSTTWGRRLYFPSEGRHAGDFSPWKIRRLRQGLNPWTWVIQASTHPLENRSRFEDGVNKHRNA
jgi:hypothetical protein